MSPTIDPSKLKVSELREELQARGLDTKGNKPVLVKRLKKALEEELNKELPDTSIADTSTEDFDSSRVEESSKNEVEVEPEAESESESKPVADQKDDDVSSQMTVEEPNDSSKIAEPSDNNENTDDKEEVPNSESNENKEEIQDDQEKQGECSESNDVEMKEVSTDVEDNQKGEKRKRTDDSSEQIQKKRPFKVTEDEPEIDPSKVLLSWYDSDLHLLVDKQSFLSAKPLHEGLFGYAWAGVRATHGINSGKVRYEVKLTQEMSWEDFTNQRRERQERAKERREKEKQRLKSSSDKNDTGEKDSKIEEKDTEEKPKDIKMEVSEEKQSDEKPVDVKMEVSEEKTNEEENPTDINDKDQTNETEESKVKTEETDIKPEESTEPSPVEENQDKESSESKADESEKSSENKVEDETPNEEKKENSEKKSDDPSTPILTHIFRTGWSVEKSSLQLGEDNFSYGYESTGKLVANKEFNDFGGSYKLGDVVGAYLNISNENVEMRFTVNGELQPEVKSIPRSEFPQENLVLFPHVLSRNFSFELNLGSKEEPWFPCPEGLEDYAFLQAVEDKIQGPVRPEKKEECEVIMMCGLPGSGKTHWVNEYLRSNNDKLTNVIGATHLLERMTVHGQPLKSTYNGQWNMLMEKLQRCLNRLGDIAAQRRRNYILDQTNVFPSAQHRKLRAFEGFKRRAVVVVVGDEEFAKRQSLKEAAVGKDVHEYTIMEMKANMALPTKGELFDEVLYSDLNEEEAKAKVSQYNTEGKTAINQKKRFRDDKGRFFNRAPYNRGGNFRDRGPPRYDRGPRGWGQLPPPGRNPRDRRPPPPPVAGGRDWMRNNRGPPRPVHDRNVRDSRPMNFNRNRNQGGGGRPNNWQSGGSSYGQGGWGGQQGNWSSANQGWGSGYQQQGNWNANSQNQWKYGGGSNQGYNQQGYGQNWNNYYGQQYPQNWSGQYS
ncbi:heterogeneous nuclear ribonucleoprotein U-like protein 2 isoform X2 [Coccinella septempunctata]|uniref:heterogeneous nuclear ribonucleoprotein U-like protein 2 isoform X2 n=1 Tax=Coccinella septempunctata TaxID=41139 RepID=UPI001D079C76|nr:heterogeneous nuclear ribonucleoprotein U-like protein 2 isoform X2 [Coccinella septempunctata]